MSTSLGPGPVPNDDPQGAPHRRPPCVSTSCSEHSHSCYLHECTETAVKKGACGRCKATWYCSQEHQKLDWKLHKRECEAFGQFHEDQKGLQKMKKFTDSAVFESGTVRLDPRGHFWWKCTDCAEWLDQGTQAGPFFSCNACNMFAEFSLVEVRG
jgi:hypothetical protein